MNSQCACGAPATSKKNIGGILEWRCKRCEAQAAAQAREDEQEANTMLNCITTGDARELSKQIPDASVDMIFTDPVYERIEDYQWLAETAARVLKPGRACLVWCSNIGQYAVQPVMKEHLRFIIPLTYTKIAKQHKAFGYKTFLWTTPCLWFQRDAQHDHEWLHDTVVDVDTNTIVSTNTPPIETYKWHKNPEAYVYWLLRFTKPDDVVWDPFTGSGSLPVECKRHGRNFIASEIKPDVAEQARKRLAVVQPIASEFLETQQELAL